MTEWQNLEVVQGNAPVLAFDLTEWSEAEGEYQPSNLTGFTVEVMVKATSETLDSLGTQITGTVTDALRGVVTVTFPLAVTQTYGTYWWRLDTIDGNSNHTTYFRGNFYVVPA